MACDPGREGESGVKLPFRLHKHTFIARLDRAIQYSETAVIHEEASAYWMPRLRGA